MAETHFIYRETVCQDYEKSVEKSRNLKEDIGSLFDPCVKVMGGRPYCPSCMEVSYCTFGLGAIIWRNLLTLLSDSPCDNRFACVI